MKNIKGFLLVCLAMICITAIVISLNGGFNFARNDDTGESGTTQTPTPPVTPPPPPPPAQSVVGASERFSIAPQQQPELKHSFTDGLFDFWHFHVGYVHFVPITWSNVRHFRQDQPALTLSFTTTTASSMGITHSSNLVTTNTTQLARNTSSTNTIQNSRTLETSMGMEVDFFSAGLKVSNTHMRSSSVTNGLVNTIGSTISITTSEAMAEHWSETSSETDTFTLTSSDLTGFYRYTLFATMDVFVAVARSTISGEFIYEFSAYARDNHFFSLEFCSNNEFTNRSATDLMVFCETMLNNLPTPRINGSNATLLHNLTGATGVDIGQIAIPYNIERAVFVGDERNFNMNIVIEPRVRSLSLFLYDVRFTAGVGKHGIGYAVGSGEHTLSITLFGNNSITGGQGRDGETDTIARDEVFSFITYSWSFSTETSIVGLNFHDDRVQNSRAVAGNGGDAINARLQNIVIQGSGSLTACGGRGGIGGNINMPVDANFYRLAYFNNLGTPGGNGGHGIVGRSVSFEFSTGDVSVAGGDGADGGNGVQVRMRWRYERGLFIVTTHLRRGAVGVFDGMDAGDGGNAILVVDNNVVHPPNRPVVLVGGQGGNGGRGLSARVYTTFCRDGYARTAISEHGKHGENGVRGDGKD